MKAVRYYGKEDIRVEEVRGANAPGPKQIVVKPRCAASAAPICTNMPAAPSSPQSTSTIHRRDPAPNPRPRVFGRGDRGRQGRDAGSKRATASRSSRS